MRRMRRIGNERCACNLCDASLQSECAIRGDSSLAAVLMPAAPAAIPMALPSRRGDELASPPDARKRVAATTGARRAARPIATAPQNAILVRRAEGAARGIEALTWQIGKRMRTHADWCWCHASNAQEARRGGVRLRRGGHVRDTAREQRHVRLRPGASDRWRLPKVELRIHVARLAHIWPVR